MKSFKKSRELPKRLFCTLCILAIFFLGRNVILYNVDVFKGSQQGFDVQSLLVNMISGDIYRSSIFALGIMPYITASILIQFGVAFLPNDVKKRISQPKIERASLIFTFFLSVFLAYTRSLELYYYSSPFDLYILRIISMVEMIIGSMIIVLMMNFNKDHGIGQQTPIILVNILQGLYMTISTNFKDISIILIMIIFCVIVITILMENVEIHIPVQRVSIHNIYADKNYIAFKLNPIGIMPVMFSTSIFTLLKYILYFFGGLFPNVYWLLWINVHMEFTDKIGILIYLGIVFLFAIVFSFVMLSPGDMADQLQKGGDSIVGVYAGKPTVWYLRRRLFLLSAFSGFVLAACMSISLFLALQSYIPLTLAMLPSSFMILIGIASNLIEEITGYLKFDSYKFFI